MNKPLFYEITDDFGVIIYMGDQVVLRRSHPSEVYQLFLEAAHGKVELPDPDLDPITNQVWLWGFIEKVAPWMRRHGV